MTPEPGEMWRWPTSYARVTACLEKVPCYVVVLPAYITLLCRFPKINLYIVLSYLSLQRSAFAVLKLSALESYFCAMSPPLDIVSPRNLRVAAALSCEGLTRVLFAISTAAAARYRGRKVASTTGFVMSPLGSLPKRHPRALPHPR